MRDLTINRQVGDIYWVKHLFRGESDELELKSWKTDPEKKDTWLDTFQCRNMRSELRKCMQYLLLFFDERLYIQSMDQGV